MVFNKEILALDLARVLGWAIGTVNSAPECGTVPIAGPDATDAKLFWCCRQYLRDFLSLRPEIGLVVFEAPLPHLMTGKTNIRTIRRLVGLVAVTEELLYDRQIDVREARVSDVRTHFLGSNRHKRDEAKRLTIARCRQLGWKVADDNAADAAALWDYQRGILIKQDLFSRGA